MEVPRPDALGCPDRQSEESPTLGADSVQGGVCVPRSRMDTTGVNDLNNNNVPETKAATTPQNNNINNNNNNTTDNNNICSMNNNHININNNSGSQQGRCLRVRTARKLIPEKIRHKRQTLQDMARPLKQWLYQHRDNPYPSKSQKMALAAGSQMTLIQVSNWFANARRRLKNTVRVPNLTWSSRIKQYNKYVVGKAELFSVDSDDSTWDSEDDNGEPHVNTDTTFPHDQPSQTISNVPSLSATPGDELHAEHMHHYDGLHEDLGNTLKYKQSILHRYLNDSYQHARLPFDEGSLPTTTRGRRQSGSLGSRDYEEMSTSSGSSPLNDLQHGVFDDLSEELEIVAKKRRTTDENCNEDSEMYWKEISAALALANLSRLRQKP